jgi:hypothetical protein
MIHSDPGANPLSIRYRVLNSGYEELMISSTRYRAMTPGYTNTTTPHTPNDDAMGTGFGGMTPGYTNITTPHTPNDDGMRTESPDVTPVYVPISYPTGSGYVDSYSPINDSYSPISQTYGPMTPVATSAPVNTLVIQDDCVQDRNGTKHSIKFLDELEHSSLRLLATKINTLTRRFVI